MPLNCKSGSPYIKLDILSGWRICVNAISTIKKYEKSNIQSAMLLFFFSFFG